MENKQLPTQWYDFRDPEKGPHPPCYQPLTPATVRENTFQTNLLTSKIPGCQLCSWSYNLCSHFSYPALTWGLEQSQKKWPL